MSSKRVTDSDISSFCSVTGASTKEARKLLEKHKRLDVAVDAYFNSGGASSTASPKTSGGGPSTSKLNALFDKYKDPDPSEDLITIDGTIALCEDLSVDPEDVVLLCVAYELKSKRMGSWERKGWVEGWRALGCDNIDAMRTALLKLRTRLAQDPAYFRKVYTHTFEFGRTDQQRSLSMDSALAFWSLLLSHGLSGSALSHRLLSPDGDELPPPPGEQGWNDRNTELWLEYMQERGGKGVSKDTWMMFVDFVRSVDDKLTRYDPEDSWPSTIDDFVEWARAKINS